jgi:hypothetical protein
MITQTLTCADHLTWPDAVTAGLYLAAIVALMGLWAWIAR